jgi:hypothetical protein
MLLPSQVYVMGIDPPGLKAGLVTIID